MLRGTRKKFAALSVLLFVLAIVAVGSQNQVYASEVKESGVSVLNTVVLAVPSNLTGVSTSSTSVTIRWGTVEGATGYKVYRSSAANGTYSYVGATKSTFFLNSGLETGITFYYKVKAYLTEETTTRNGELSEAVAATPVATAPLVAAPAMISAVPQSDNSMVVKWNAVSGVTGYKVYRSDTSNGTYSYVGATLKTEFRNTGLTGGATYYYKVRAYLNSGTTSINSDFSGFVMGKIASGVVIPSAPTGLKADPVSSGSLKLTWNAVSGVTGYKVYRSDSVTGTYSYIGATKLAEFTNSGITAGVSYFYKVKAYTNVDTTTLNSDFSVHVEGKINLAVVVTPSIPQNVTAVSASISSIKLTWTPISGVSGYKVYRATSLNGTYSYIGATKVSEFISSGLNPDMAYFYKIKSFYTEGTTTLESGLSTAASAQWGVMDSLIVKAMNYDYITIGWNAVPGATGYKVYRALSENGLYTYVGATTKLELMNKPVETGVSYFYKVRPYVTSNGVTYNGVLSNFVNATPKLGIPTFTKATVTGFNHVELQWTPVAGNPNYYVYFRFGPDEPWAFRGATPETQLILSHLDGDTTYQFAVATFVIDERGNHLTGEFSQSVTVTTRSMPAFSTMTSPETFPYTIHVGFFMENKGSKLLRIRTDNAFLSDNDFYEFDRDLHLIDFETERDVNYIDLPPNTSNWIFFRVIGTPTWYDPWSIIYFEFDYDQAKYEGSVSYAYQNAFTLLNPPTPY